MKITISKRKILGFILIAPLSSILIYAFITEVMTRDIAWPIVILVMLFASWFKGISLLAE